MAVFQILKSFFLHFSEKTKQCALCFRVLVHEITRTQKYSFHMVWGSKIYYTPAKQINYTWKKQQYKQPLVFSQVCFSLYQHLPFLLWFPFQLIRIERIHTQDINLPWNRKKYRSSHTNPLHSQLSEILTFEANIFHFLSKPLQCKLFYHFPHLPGRDLSKLVGNSNTKHWPLWYDVSNTDFTLKIFWEFEAAGRLMGFSAA